MAGGIVIIGAGIIGCATAYYLSNEDEADATKIHLVESSTELFASASGKGAGFLASDWFGPATAELGALSFRLHKELAEEYHGLEQWGYSRSTGTSLAQSMDPSQARGDDWLRDGGSRAQVAAVHDYAGPSKGPAWLQTRHGEVLDTISTDDSVAQVDPLRLSQFLLRSSMRKGIHLHQPAEVVQISTDDQSALRAVIIKDTRSGAESTIECDRILIAAGAWSGRVFDKLFPNASADVYVGQLAGHSIVVQSPRWVEEHETDGCHAVFSTLRTGFSPEIFSRIGGEIYVAGLNDAALPLPNCATEAAASPASISELKQVAERLLGKDGTDVSDLKIVREGLCFRPITRSGNPILSQIPNGKLGADITAAKVYIAAGHGPWGISHSLGTGKVMSEMLQGTKLSANISRLALR